MRLPAPLLRNKKNVHKNTFGHVLVLAGSPAMAGAAALCGLAAMRSGAGLVTLGIPKSMNAIVQKKISPVIMTWPLPETSEHTLAPAAYRLIKKRIGAFSVVALGPGLSQNKSTRAFLLKIITQTPKPLIIDADGLNALAGHLHILKAGTDPIRGQSPSKSQGQSLSISIKILTPHPGEMARLLGRPKVAIEKNRLKTAKDFALAYKCVVLLKGHRTIVADPSGRTYINTTGNPGMATAGSGDVLTGMIAAFLAQGLSGFEAAKWGAYIHGKAGDLAAKAKGRVSLIATDIIEQIPKVFGILNS